MKIIFLNVCDAEQKEELRKYLIKESISTDVFCFQEVRESMQELCDEVLSGFTRIMVNKTINDKIIFDNATYIRSGIDILETDAIFANDKKMGLGLFTKISFDNKNINIINVHGCPEPYDKKDTDERLKQSRELISYTKNFTETIIIGGDFNLDKDIQSVKMFESYQFNNLIEEFGIETTRNEISWSKFKNKQYFADFLFTKRAIVKSFEVPDSAVSDHLAMILEI